MSKYTTEVRYICENYAGLDKSADYSQVNSVVQTAAPLIFEQFEIFDEQYRLTLETKILRHYYTREICAETVGLWKLWLNNKMHEIMPFYNQLYKSELLKFNPLYDVDYTTTKAGSGNTSKSEDRSYDSEGKNIKSKISNREENESLEENRNDINSLVRNENSSENEKIDRENIQNKNINRNAENNENATENKTGTNIKSENNTSDITKNSTNRDAYSDTPQGSLTDVDNNTYLTTYRKIGEDGSENANENKNGITSDRQNNTSENSSVKNENENEGKIENENNKRANDFEKNENESEINKRNLTNNTGRNSNSNENEIGNNIRNENENFDSVITSTDQYLMHVQGKRSSTDFSKLLIEFRKTFLNIDSMIINELAPLFMGVY